MKRIILAFMLSNALYFLNAQQITLETTVPDQTSQKELYVIETYSLKYHTKLNYGESERVVKYYQFVKKDETGMGINVYNLDFSFYKYLLFESPTGYLPSHLAYATTNMFNSDSKIEFIPVFKSKTATGGELNIAKLYNEDGLMLYDFVDIVPWYAIKDIENNFVLQARSDITSITSYYTVKHAATKVSAVNIKRNALPYPNPAAQTINLPYQLNPGEQADMQIYDVNGKLIATKRLDATFDKIVLNVSGYEKGMYVYKYNGKSAKFVVE